MNTLHTKDPELTQFMDWLERRNPYQFEFHQAVEEIATSLIPFIRENSKYKDANILERITEPDRIISFRVTWMSDSGEYRVNRGFRVQFNNCIGPYKGGLRFHPSVTQSVLKFLGFEQIFKNSLTGLPMGGAKGGSDFNPKGKSDNEIMRFCYSFMTELSRHIGEDTDIPAGDIGVGAREISYLFGQYKRMQNRFVGTITGKGLEYGGSLVRKEATGYGCIYFLENMLQHHNDSINGKTISVSGSGNVSLYAIQKATELGGKVVTASDSSGFIHDPEGISGERLNYLIQLKEVDRGRIHEYADKFSSATFYAGQRPWGVKTDIALPCATQNELNNDEALQLVKNGVVAVAEGANMPTTMEGIQTFSEAGVLFAPAKAANAGGVAVSGLEQSQNALRISWSRGEVNTRLQTIMHDIHKKCVDYGQDGGKVINYTQGANIGGFVKVADAMLSYGAI